MKIKNLTSSPYQLVNAKGEKIMLPANGELTDFEPHPMQISHYRTLGYFEITQDDEKPEPKKTRKK